MDTSFHAKAVRLEEVSYLPYVIHNLPPFKLKGRYSTHLLHLIPQRYNYEPPKMSSPSLITTEEKSPSIREPADESSCTNAQGDPRIDKQVEENLSPGIASGKLNEDQQAAREKKMVCNIHILL
jgi:hypothetical protein